MVSSRQQEQYTRVIESLTKPRTSCRHAQCFGANKKHTRCQLCINADRAKESRTPRCRFHLGVKGGFNRRGQLILGFDPILMQNSAHKFADDAIQTALTIMAPRASTLRVQLGWLSEQSAHVCEYTNRQAPRFFCYICNLDDHWFMILMHDESEMFVFNSINWNMTAARIRRLKGMDKFTGKCMRVENLPQQVNELDCGAFAIFFTYCYVFNRPIPDQLPIGLEERKNNNNNVSTSIRHATVLFLLSKDQAYLEALCTPTA